MTGFVATSKGITQIGQLDIFTHESEFTFNFKNNKLKLSYAHNNMTSFETAVAATEQGVSAAPLGYGNDLDNTAKNSIKIHWSYKAFEKLHLHTSLRKYWDWQGTEDLVNYASVNDTETNWLAGEASSDEGYDDYKNLNLLWTLGIRYEPQKNAEIKETVIYFV